MEIGGVILTLLVLWWLYSDANARQQAKEERRKEEKEREERESRYAAQDAFERAGRISIRHKGWGTDIDLLEMRASSFGPDGEVHYALARLGPGEWFARGGTDAAEARELEERTKEIEDRPEDFDEATLAAHALECAERLEWIALDNDAGAGFDVGEIEEAWEDLAHVARSNPGFDPKKPAVIGSRGGKRFRPPKHASDSEVRASYSRYLDVRKAWEKFYGADAEQRRASEADA